MRRYWVPMNVGRMMLLLLAMSNMIFFNGQSLAFTTRTTRTTTTTTRATSSPLHLFPSRKTTTTRKGIFLNPNEFDVNNNKELPLSSTTTTRTVSSRRNLYSKKLLQFQSSLIRKRNNHQSTTSLSSSSSTTPSVQNKMRNRLIRFLSGTAKRPDWAKQWMPTWLLTLRPSTQLFVIVFFYLFHVLFLSQHSIPLPFQLIPNERGHFQSIGLDSLAGMATLAFYQYLRHTPIRRRTTTTKAATATEPTAVTVDETNVDGDNSTSSSMLEETLAVAEEALSMPEHQQQELVSSTDDEIDDLNDDDLHNDLNDDEIEDDDLNDGDNKSDGTTTATDINTTTTTTTTTTNNNNIEKKWENLFAVPSLISTPRLRDMPWKNIYQSQYSRITSILAMAALFYAYSNTILVSMWWEDVFYVLGNFYPITVPMHRSLTVLFGHLSWMGMGGIILRCIPRPQNFFSPNTWYTQNFFRHTNDDDDDDDDNNNNTATQFVWWTIGGYYISSLLFNISDTITQWILPIPVLQQAQDSLVSRLTNPEYNDWLASIVGYIAPCLTAPWWEEVLYRGFLLPAIMLLLKNNFLWSVLLNGIIFSAHHHSLTGAIPLAVLGSVWSILYTKSGNLLTSILVHAMWNTRIFVGSWFGL